MTTARKSKAELLPDLRDHHRPRGETLNGFSIERRRRRPRESRGVDRRPVHTDDHPQNLRNVPACPEMICANKVGQVDVSRSAT